MNSLKYLNKYFKKYKARITAGILFILLSNGFQILIPLQLRLGINSILSNAQKSEIIKYSIYITAAALLSGLFRFLIRETLIVLSRKIEFDLRQDLWVHLQKLPVKFFKNNSTGNLMSHATNDISAVRMYLGPGIMYSLDTTTKFIIVISIMLNLNWLLTIYVLIPLPFLSYFVYKLSKKIHKKFNLIQEKFSEITTRAQENFAGIRIIKSYVREQREIEAFKKLSKDYLNRNMDKVRIQAYFMPILFLISGTSIIIVIWAGGSMVIKHLLTLGDLSAFILYLGFLIWPMIAFGWILNIIQQASASMKRLLVILNEKREVEDSATTDWSIKSISGEIEFKDVSFSYGENKPDVLNSVTFKIPGGSTAAFIGRTGAGKSSLVNLIPRLYDVTKGEVLIDGLNVKNIPLALLRRNIGMAPQETFLFSETIANNILYGTENKEESKLTEAARISAIEKDVIDFPEKYNTSVGEKGVTLSGGQKQRVCLARAIAIEPKILILDDSFSAVDTNTEEEILQNLKNFLADRTFILISHRISTVKNADKIYVLEKGKIVEEGTHNELLKLEGVYANIYRKQQLEKELAEIK